MTDKKYVMTDRGMEKMPGWFSWRHENREAHEAASERYRSTHGPAARRKRAAERAAVPTQVERTRRFRLAQKAA